MKPELADPILWKHVQKQIDDDFGEGVSKKILGDCTLAILEQANTRSLYLIPYEWMSVVNEDFVDFDIRYMGLWLGDMVKDRVRLSLPILERLSPFTENVLIVTKRSAEAFTYGRSIIKEGVVSLTASLQRGQRVIVKDGEGHILGLALLSVDGHLLPRLANDKLVAKNLVDIGWYLRRLG